MKKFLFAAVCTFTLVGYVVADEFSAQITKVDGKNVSYFKTEAGGKGGGGKGGGKGGFGGGKRVGDEQKATAADSCKVSKGMFDMDTKSFKAGDPIEGGLNSDMFKNIDSEKGVNVTITIADSGADKGKITSIVTKGGKKKGG
jgi:hypothetical protein